MKDCIRELLKERYTDEIIEGIDYAFSKSPPFPDTIPGVMRLKKIAKLGIISNTERG
ncbi:MAG: hypothetical protein RXR43_14935 [Sulfolobus sp.]